MSPSWISLWVKVSFGFMSSIMPGLISYTLSVQRYLLWRLFAYLVELQWSPWRPSHALVDDAYKVANFATSENIYLADTVECLFRCIEVLDEDHNRAGHNLGLHRIGYNIQV